MLESLFRSSTKNDIETTTQVAIAPAVVREDLKSTIGRSMAVIEFTPQGDILDANQNFLNATGYRLDELKGRHHRMFVDESYAKTDAYKQLWQRLAAGECVCGEVVRVSKTGSTIWLYAIYSPIKDTNNKVVGVVKIASDITRQKESEREVRGRTQALIEFTPDGVVLSANQLFLDTMGYSLNEIKGQHHRIFMPDGEANSLEYKNFWGNLASGHYVSGRFVRSKRDGSKVWLDGSYNPVFDATGKVVRVFKVASDATGEVRARERTAGMADSIARSVNEMSVAIRDISARITRTADLARTSSNDARTVDETAERLNSGSREIGKVVELIQDMADQTNLLALNATIEAARAGEHGKGFTVVASEVKELARRTSAATSSISTCIQELQKNISEVITSVAAISTRIDHVSENTTGISAAVEEQSVLMASLSDTALQLVEA